MFVLQGCGLLNNANNEPNSGNPQTDEGISETNKNEPDPIEEEPVEEDPTINIRIAAVGDIMAHETQLISAYNTATDSYDFTSVFEDIRPIIEEADLAIGNFETTLAGPSKPYSGYPAFNAPDTLVDALVTTGFDTLITVNNHSLDTGLAGLKRTVQVIEDKELDAVGTFNEIPESRFVLKEVEGIKIAILAYTELINMDAGLSNEELNSALNLMDKNRILNDLEQVKSHNPDMIIAYMHWGNEYAKEANAAQLSYAELLTQEGIDIIFGSHPHVIQKAEMVSVGDKQSFVTYSLGNFISNQRRETLGEGFEPTEDGVIVTVDVEKNTDTNETTIQAIEMIPTWVYRAESDEENRYTFRILPTESAIEQGTYSEEVLNKLKASQAETKSRLQFDFQSMILNKKM